MVKFFRSTDYEDLEKRVNAFLQQADFSEYILNFSTVVFEGEIVFYIIIDMG